jgi:hypothetical protein
MAFSERGQRLYDAYATGVDAARLVLLEEAARIADRLDELALVIAGKGVLNLMSFRLDLDLEDETGDRNINVRVEFSNVLGEARQQALALRQLLASLPVKGTDGDGDDESWLDDVEAALRDAAG